MTRKRSSRRPANALSFAVEALEPRLLLSADWALGLAPDDVRDDPFDLDAAAAHRVLRALGSEAPLPASMDLEHFMALQPATPEFANDQSLAEKPSRTDFRLLSGDAPQSVDDGYSVNEDESITFNAVWFDPDWIARRELTIDNSASATDLNDFPVLITLDASRIDYSLTEDDGDDLRFTDDAGNLLDYEIELWDESGTSYVWVRVDSITAGSTTESIYMYYGNSSAGEGQSPRDVWDANYQQVQHLEETSGNYDDSTANGVDISLSGGDPHGDDMFIGPAHAFDGTNELDSQPEALDDSRAAGTISMWVEFDERSGVINLLTSDVARDQAIWTDDGTFHVAMATNLFTFSNLSGGSIENGWNQVVFTWDSVTGEQALYANGLLVDQVSVGAWDPDGVDGNTINIGGAADAFLGFFPERDGLQGGIDEIRVSDVARSADWVAAQFATINDNFISYGAEEGAARGVLENDTDAENDVLAAVLETGPSNAASFTLFADGSFEYTPQANFVGTDSFTYRADDGSSLSAAAATVTITVNAVNDAPTFTLGGAQNVTEDGGGQSVANFSVASAGGGADESGQTFTYIVTGDNPGLFSVAPSIDADGTLTYTLAPNAVGSANLTVQMSDSGGTANGGSDAAVAENFVINVAPVNDAPSATLLGNQTVVENAGPQAVANFAAGFTGGGADESGQNLSYTVITGFPALFSAAPAISPDGTLTFTFADGMSGSTTVDVIVRDDGGTANGGQDTSTTYTFTLTATPASVPPTALNMDQTLSYIEDNTLDLANIIVSDGDAGDVITATLTLADPLAGSLSTLSGAGETYVAATGRWRIVGTQAEVNTALANVTFVPAANYALDTSIAVNIQDADGTGPADGLIELNALAVNDAPSATLAGDVNVLENSGPQTIAGFAVGFVGGGTDEAGQALTYIVSADQVNMFSSGPVISSDGTLSFTTADNVTGSATVRVRVIDDGNTANGGQNQSVDYTFNIIINDRPDAPTTTNMNQVVLYTEDGGPVDFADMVVSDDDPGETITATLTLADPTAGVLTTLSGSGETYNAVAGQWQITGNAATVNAALANLSFAPGANYALDTSINVRIVDAAGTGPSDGTIALQAIAINDTPQAIFAGDIAVDQNAGAQTFAGFATPSPGGGTDELAQTFTYTVTVDNGALFSVAPAITPDGTLTFTAADNTSGSTTVRVRVTDSGDTVNGGQDQSIEYVFQIDIGAPTATNLNQVVNYIEDGDPVGFDAIVVSNAAPDETITATLSLSDPAAGSLSTASGLGETLTTSGQWRITGTVAQVNAALADVTFTAANNYAQDLSIVVRITDAAGNGPADGLLALQATAVNDAPLASQLNQIQNFLEDTIDVALNDIVVSDVDAGDVVSATLTLDNPAAGQLSSSSGNGESYDARSGTWRVSGSTAQVSAALAAVVFEPLNDFAGSVSVRTQIVDQDGAGPDAGVITLQATAVNDAPTVAVSGDLVVDEDAPAQRIAGFANVLDNGGADESGQTIVYSLSTDNEDLFRVAPSISETGELHYELAANANGTANITVVARDDGGRDNGGVDTAPTQQFVIQVNPVNDAPEATSQFVVAPPSGIVVLSAASFGFTDPADGDTFEGVFITSLPAQGELLLDGQPVAAGAFVSAADLVANRLSLSSFAIPGDSLLLSFDFLVRDSGGTADGGTDVAVKTSTITISVDVPKTDGTTNTTPAVISEADASADTTTATVVSDADQSTDEQRSAPAIDLSTPASPATLAPTVAVTTPVTSLLEIPQAADATQAAKTFSPAVSRVLVSLLENVRSGIGDATVIQTTATTTLAAVTEILVEQLSDLRDETGAEQASEELVIMQSSAVAFGLSVGYVSWLLRGGVLVSSMLTSLPAWRFIDPLPIFSGVRQGDEDEESLQDIVSADEHDTGPQA